MSMRKISRKNKSKIDIELLEKIRRGLEDIKNGRIKEWKS